MRRLWRWRRRRYGHEVLRLRNHPPLLRLPRPRPSCVSPARKDSGAEKLQSVERAARKRLEALNAAESLNDLRALPGNRLEALVGDRKGQHSIRVNDRYRICFVWTEAGAEDVEIVDYH